MRRVIISFLLLFLVFSAMAQLEVKEGSFKKVDGFVNINPDIQSDDNDILYAVIKVKTENINDKQRHELLFESNAATFIELEYKVGEVWIYISSRPATYLKISHPDMSSTEFWLPYDLEPKQGYVMTLVNKAMAKGSGFGSITITTIPDDATLTMNGRTLNQKTPYLNDMIAVGAYEIIVSKDNYISETKQIEIKDKSLIEIEINLTPICGVITVDTEPQGAMVFIDGVEKGVTPIIINDVQIGNHEFRLKKDNYATIMESFSLDKDNIVNIKKKLVDGRQVIISTNKSNDEIYIDGNYIGNSPLTISLCLGEHEIMAVHGYKGTITELESIMDDNGTLVVNKKITVKKNDKDINIRLLFDFENKFITVNGISFEMIAVEGGGFIMGATPEQDEYAEKDEKPTHNVILNDYYIGKFEVTKALWNAVMEKEPSINVPMDNVSWDDCQEFLNKINKITGLVFRLPTEAEWEFAARGGKKCKGYKYSGGNSLKNVGWYVLNSSNITQTVGTKSPNELGIYDMSGNVYEWCQDYYGKYMDEEQTNPVGPIQGAERVRRGGSWFNEANDCRVSYRSSLAPTIRSSNSGFRLVLDVD